MRRLGAGWGVVLGPVRVVRGGAVREEAAERLVVGDLLLLNAPGQVWRQAKRARPLPRSPTESRAVLWGGAGRWCRRMWCCWRAGAGAGAGAD
jgi:hypothetical protein